MSRKPKRPWTPAEDKRLLELAAKGVNYRHLSRMFNRPRGTICSRIYALRNPRPAPTPKAPAVQATPPSWQAWDEAFAAAIAGRRFEEYRIPGGAVVRPRAPVQRSWSNMGWAAE